MFSYNLLTRSVINIDTPAIKFLTICERSKTRIEAFPSSLIIILSVNSSNNVLGIILENV